MEYVSTSEIAKIWDISHRRVTTLCREGRVEGAVLLPIRGLCLKMQKNRKIREESVKWERKKSRIYMIDELSFIALINCERSV